MRKVPPVAAVAAKGPLGVVQLPRLWSKVLLDQRGLLPEGYYPCGLGFDKIVLDGLGLDREEVLAFLTSEGAREWQRELSFPVLLSAARSVKG